MDWKLNIVMMSIVFYLSQRFNAILIKMFLKVTVYIHITEYFEKEKITIT